MSPPEALTPSAVAARLRACGCVFAEDEARLLASAAPTAADLAAMVERRCSGMPLEHVVGWADFCGLRVAVEPGVFVPRPRTEFLVRRAAALARRAADAAGCGERAVVVDLCCGSGALAAALAALGGPIQVHAVDIDATAVRCARRNLARIGGRVYHGDLDRPLPATLRGRVQVMCANVPYVPTAELALLPPEAREHEPRAALDGGADGLDVLRRVAAAAPRWLAPGGHLLVETSERQAARATDAVERAGLIPHPAASDDLSATVVVGTLPGR